jgi:hypothetical protein
MGMLRWFAATAALLFLFAGSTPARADILARDDVPAATLLFPYFEVDLDDPQGNTTLLTWRNTSATAILGHVTIYSDLGIPVLSFNTYLTGYDVVTFDVRAMLDDGVLPVTASAGQDPGDMISPQGNYSQDINFASCNGQIPYQTPVLFPATVADLQSQLTGGQSQFNGLCSGFDHGDRVARGYVTVDTVNNCTQRVANDPGYFGSGGTGDATNQNVMAGEYTLFGPQSRLLHAGAAVAVEASTGEFVPDENTPDPFDGVFVPDPDTTVPGQYTFYGRNVAYTAADNREPLPATWAVDNQAHKGELIVWRDPKVAASPFNCSLDGPASFFPLSQESIIQFDVQAQPHGTPAGLPFTLATQRVAFGSAELPVPAKTGWIYLGLNTTVVGAGSNPPEDPASAQSYVTVLQYPEYSDVGGSAGAAMALDAAGSTSVHSHPLEFTP